MVLLAGGEGVDAEGGTGRRASAVVALRPLAPAAAVYAAVVLPGDDPAAAAGAGEPGHLRVVLTALGVGVGAHLAAQGHAAAAEALEVDAVGSAVLAAGSPGDDVAAVGQLADVRVLLRGGGIGVDALLAIDERRAVQRRRDIDDHHRGRAGAAVAVRDAQADAAAGGRALRAAGVAEVLHQGLHGIHAGAGQQVDTQVAAVGSTGDGADGGAAVAHGGGGHADLPGTVAYVAHAQGVGGFAAHHVVQVETATRKIRRVKVVQTDRGVERLERGVGRVLRNAHAAAEVTDGRALLARRGGGAAEDLLRDAVGVGAAIDAGVVIGVDHDEVAVAEVGDGGQVLGAVARRDELAFAVDRQAGRVVLADVDVAGGAAAGDVVVVVVPGDDEATGGQRRDLGLVLAAQQSFVDDELRPELVAGGVETLAVDAVARAVVAGIVLPDDDETAVGEHRHRGLVLRAGGGGVDLEGAAEAGRGGVVGAAEDAVAAGAVVVAVIAPDDHQVAIRARGDLGQVLWPGLRRADADTGADAQLAALLGAGVVEALQVNVVAVAAGVAGGGPDDAEARRDCAAAGPTDDIAVALGAGGEGVGDEVRAHRRAGGGVDLADHAVAAAVGTGPDVVPDDDIVAIGQCRHARHLLRAGARGVDEELRPDGLAAARHALRIDVVLRIRLVVAAPDHDIAAVSQRGSCGLVLGCRAVGVHPLLAVQGRRAVGLARDEDRLGIAGAGAAVAVGDAQAHRAAAGRA